jgi:hypothetical protein
MANRVNSIVQKAQGISNPLSASLRLPLRKAAAYLGLTECAMRERIWADGQREGIQARRRVPLSTDTFHNLRELGKTGGSHAAG